MRADYAVSETFRSLHNFERTARQAFSRSAGADEIVLRKKPSAVPAWINRVGVDIGHFSSQGGLHPQAGVATQAGGGSARCVSAACFASLAANARSRDALLVLQRALGVTAEAARAFLLLLESAEAPAWPHLTAEAGKDDALALERHVYIRLVNALWSTQPAVLPMPFNTPPPGHGHPVDSIARVRVGQLIDRMQPLVSQHLRSMEGARVCLEWDSPRYLREHFAATCSRQDVFVYSATRQAVGTAPDGTVVWSADLARPLAPEIPRGQLALVVAAQVLEHVANPFRCVANVHEMLAPGGVLLLTAPFQYPYHGVPHDYFRYTLLGLEAVLNASGFSSTRSWAAGGRRELEAMNAGFWAGALPPELLVAGQEVTHEEDQVWYHTVAAFGVRPLTDTFHPSSA